MKNMKKLALLLSLFVVFAISCQKVQNSLDASFELGEEIPNNGGRPPVMVEGEQFPSDDFKLSKENFSFEITQGNWGQTDTFDVRKGNKISQYNITTAIASIENSTRNTYNEQDVINSIKVNATTMANRYAIRVENTMYNALGAGNSAKIKVTLYINATDANGNKFETGTKELYVSVTRTR